MDEITQAAASAIGEEFRRARTARGWSQEQFAAESELDRSYVGQVERGEKNISLESVLRIARALRRKPSDIFKDAGY